MGKQEEPKPDNPQEFDKGSPFPDPTPIPTIDLSSLTQPAYSQEVIQIQIPDIPTPPPIPTIDMEIFFEREDISEIAPKTPPMPTAPKAAAPAAVEREMADGQVLWEQVMSQKKPARKPRRIPPGKVEPLEVQKMPVQEKLKRIEPEVAPAPSQPKQVSTWSKVISWVIILLVLLSVCWCAAECFSS